jgi:hypothetical protein
LRRAGTDPARGMDAEVAKEDQVPPRLGRYKPRPGLIRSSLRPELGGLGKATLARLQAAKTALEIGLPLTVMLSEKMPPSPMVETAESHSARRSGREVLGGITMFNARAGSLTSALRARAGAAQWLGQMFAGSCDLASSRNPGAGAP